MSNNIRRVVQLICVKLGNHQPISLRSLIKSSETIYNKSFCFKEDYYDQSHFLSHKCYSDYSNRQFFWKIRSACYQPSCSHRCNCHYFYPIARMACTLQQELNPNIWHHLRKIFRILTILPYLVLWQPIQRQIPKPRLLLHAQDTNINKQITSY